MRLLRAGTLVGVISLVLLAGTPAMADPPPTNPNAMTFTVACTRGAETLSFQMVSIVQNNSIAGQLVDGNGVAVVVHAEFNGQVAYDVPGQSARPDLWTCTIAEFGAGVVVKLFVTPRG
jgi:hypothetical protein